MFGVSRLPYNNSFFYNFSPLARSLPPEKTWKINSKCFQLKVPLLSTSSFNFYHTRTLDHLKTPSKMPTYFFSSMISGKLKSKETIQKKGKELQSSMDWKILLAAFVDYSVKGTSLSHQLALTQEPFLALVINSNYGRNRGMCVELLFQLKFQMPPCEQVIEGVFAGAKSTIDLFPILASLVHYKYIECDQALVDRLYKTDPSRRFSTIKELLEEFKIYQDQTKRMLHLLGQPQTEAKILLKKV